MNRFLIILLVLPALGIQAVEAQDFSVKEKAVIYTNAIKLLQDYQSVINQIGEYTVSDVEKAKSSSEGFLELFVNRQVLLYNDLDPTHKLSEFYEAETYSSNIILWYPDGMTVNLDIENAKASEVMKHEESVFSLDIMAKKTTNGNYNNETPNKESEDLTFRVAFGFENGSFRNFRIAGIRKASSSFIIDYSQVMKEVNLEDFADEDLDKIHNEIKTVLHDYLNYLSLLGDIQETAEDKDFYKTSFIKLFQNNETLLYNDLVPDPQSTLISVTDYLNTYISDYPTGINNISVNIDSAKFGNIIKAGDGTLFTYITANKFFSGTYKGKEPFRNMSPLIFKISFQASGKTFTDFLITSIDFSSVNFYKADTGAQIPNKPELQIKPVTRKGFTLSVTGAFGQTKIEDQDIENMTLEANSHKWDISPLYGYIGAVGLSYYLSDNFGIRSGIEFNKYAEAFSLSGNFQDKDFSTDINGTNFHKIIEAEYDSLVTINYLTVPLLLNFVSGKPGKLGFYAETGVKLSFPIKVTYTCTGNYNYMGYYPGNPEVLQYLSLAELGFYTRENIDNTGTISTNPINIAFYASTGLNIPLGYFASLNIGPEITLGLTDIMSDKTTYVDIFEKPYDHKPTKIRNFGIRLSFTYKL